MAKALTSVLRWLGRRPAYVLLSASAEELAQEPPSRFRHAWLGLTGLSLVWGLCLVGVWAIAWDLFRDYELLLMPSLATLAFFILGPFRLALLAMLEVLTGRQGPLRAVVAPLLVVGLAMCFLSLRQDAYRSEYAMPAMLAWLRPVDKMYRVLVLMPLWGAWTMLILPHFCRPGPGTEPPLAAMARGCGPMAAAAALVLPLAGSIFYFHYLGWGAQVKISAWAVMAALVGGVICCRASKGLCRQALLASNLLTQVIFLLAFLANR